MSNLRIKDCDYLEKDPESGAIVLSQRKCVEDIKLDNLMRKLSFVEKQNNEILELLRRLVSSDS